MRLTLTASRQLLVASGDGIYRLDLSALDLTVPRLSITREGANAALFWPAGADAFCLQSAASLNPPTSWVTVSGSAEVSNGQKMFTIGLTGPVSFFRLVKP